jgi:hypothetical protein
MVFMKKLAPLIYIIFAVVLSGCAGTNPNSTDTLVTAGKIYRNTKTGEVFDEYRNLEFRLDKAWCDDYVDEHFRSYPLGKQLDESESCLRRLGYERVTEQAILPPTSSPFISPSAVARLKELNNLRDKGLITEDDYKKNREEILSE